MATADQPQDRPTADTRVLDELERHIDLDPAARKLYEYLTGKWRPDQVSMQQHIIPALQSLNGAVAIRYDDYNHKTEWVWPAESDIDTVSSCYYDSPLPNTVGEAMHTDVPFTRDELADFRGVPEPDAFVHRDMVPTPVPSHALPSTDGEH